MPKLKSFQSPVEILRTYNVKFSLDYLFHSFLWELRSSDVCLKVSQFMLLGLWLKNFLRVNPLEKYVVHTSVYSPLR